MDAAETAPPFPLALVFLGGLCLVSIATLVIVILIYVKVSKRSAAQQTQYSPMPQQPVQYPPQDQQQAAPQPPPAQPPTDPQQQQQ